MTNINDEDIDLGLTLGSANHRIRTRLSNTRGAGVNANSTTMDMAFAASDPLSELVWSPHNGLSLKCADSSLAANKPFFLWNVGPSNHPFSASRSIESQGSEDEKAVNERKLSASRRIIDANDRFGSKSVLPSLSSPGTTNDKMEEQAGTKDAIQKDENSMDDREENLRHQQHIQVADIAESSKRNFGPSTLLDACEAKVDISRKTRSNENCNSATCSNIMGLDAAIPFETDATKVAGARDYSLPILETRKEPEDEVNSAIGDVNKNQAAICCSIPGPKVEAYAENDLYCLTAKDAGNFGETGLPLDNNAPVEGSPTNSRICTYREKGKGKALSDGDIYGRSSHDKDDSRESAESCNSAGLISKGMKRRSDYNHEMTVGSKRIRKQIEESPCSTSILRYRSSFMNWISNMVKGLSDSNKEESPLLTLTNARSDDVSGMNKEIEICETAPDSAERKTGFQNVFKSLYCHTKSPRTREQVGGDSVQESRELMVAEKRSVDDLPRICESNNDNSCKQIVISNEEAKPSNTVVSDGVILFGSLDKSMNSPEKDESLQIPSATDNVPETRNPLSSLWITRFCTRTPNLENYNQLIQESRECSAEGPKINLECQVNDVCPLNQISCEAGDNSAEEDRLAANAEACVDLKSSRKLVPIPPSQSHKSSEAIASVFARRLDALRHITPSTSSLACFFCGKSGHELQDCPEITETELEDLLVKFGSFDAIKNCSSHTVREDVYKLRLGSLPSYHLSWNVKESSSKRVSASNGLRNCNASNSDDIKENGVLPLCNFASGQNSVASLEMFRAIRKLRLSRADILRWMSSNVPLSHLNGFFLRLRLGKVEAGVGGTGYYVARITGYAREHRSKKAILVDVGGIISSVGSQYVSNQDFLEDEIKAWWCRIVQTGCKIPSLDELNAKLNDRKRLGF